MGDATTGVVPSSVALYDAYNALNNNKASTDNPTLRWTMSTGETIELRRAGSESNYGVSLVQVSSDGATKTFHNLITSDTEKVYIEFYSNENIKKSTTDLVAGTSPLNKDYIYLVYEE